LFQSFNNNKLTPVTFIRDLWIIILWSMVSLHVLTAWE
jgi:hypothetical protein